MWHFSSVSHIVSRKAAMRFPFFKMSAFCYTFRTSIEPSHHRPVGRPSDGCPMIGHHGMNIALGLSVDVGRVCLHRFSLFRPLHCEGNHRVPRSIEERSPSLNPSPCKCFNTAADYRESCFIPGLRAITVVGVARRRHLGQPEPSL